MKVLEHEPHRALLSQCAHIGGKHLKCSCLENRRLKGRDQIGVGSLWCHTSQIREQRGASGSEMPASDTASITLENPPSSVTSIQPDSRSRMMERGVSTS
jgi:hypothetical protein